MSSQRKTERKKVMCNRQNIFFLKIKNNKKTNTHNVINE